MAAATTPHAVALYKAHAAALNKAHQQSLLAASHSPKAPAAAAPAAPASVDPTASAAATTPAVTAPAAANPKAKLKPTTAKGKAHLAKLLQKYHDSRPATLQGSILSPNGIAQLASQIASEQTQPTIDAANTNIKQDTGMQNYQAKELQSAQGQTNSILQGIIGNLGSTNTANQAALAKVGSDAGAEVTKQMQTQVAAQQANDASRGIVDPNGTQAITDRFGTLASNVAARQQTAGNLGNQLGQVGQNFLSGLAGITAAGQPQQLGQVQNRFGQDIQKNQAAIASAMANQGNIQADTTEKLNQTNFVNLATLAQLGNTKAQQQLQFAIAALNDKTSATNNAASNATSAANNAANNATSAANAATAHGDRAAALAERKRHDRNLEKTAGGRLELSREQFTNKLDSGGKLTLAEQVSLGRANDKLRGSIGAAADYVANEIGKPKIVTTVGNDGKPVRTQSKYALADIKSYLDEKLQNPAAVQAALDLAGLSPNVTKGTIAAETAKMLKAAHIGVPSSWYTPPSGGASTYGGKT